MAAKSSAGKKKDPSRGQSATPRTKARKNSRKRTATAAKSSSGSPSGPRSLLPSLAVWIMAVVVLAGLLYWGKTFKTTSQEASSSQQSGAKPSGHSAKMPIAKKAPPDNRPAPAPSVKSEEKKQPSAAALPAEHSPPKPGAKESDKIAYVEPIPEKITPPVKPEPAPTMAQVAIVIDDFGQDLGVAKKFLNIPLAITYSILPFQAHSEEIMRLAAGHGHEVILHLPMEPIEYPRINPGRGALLVAMSETKIQQTLKTALDAYPNISGVNNHMGSKFTKQSDAMKVVLTELKHRGLYFLDSFTTEQSVGYTVARKLNIPTRRRDIFLDHENTETFVRAQIKQLIRKAKLQGSAMAIGHPYEATYKVLLEEAPRFRKEGIAVVYSGRLIKGTDASKMNGG